MVKDRVSLAMICLPDGCYDSASRRQNFADIRLFSPLRHMDLYLSGQTTEDLMPLNLDHVF
jgi:hypothetical protein